MYSMDARIRYSECGANKKATLGAMINYFQDCTSENSERLGVGVEYLKEKKRAWILNSWQVVVHRYPEMSEKIVISTWATGFKGVFGPRDFCMKTKDGEMLACAHTLWVYVDTETGRPTKADEEEIAIYDTEEPLPMENASRKIKLPETVETISVFTVRRFQIDTNRHVNNSQYVQMATEALPEHFKVTNLRVEYKKAAVYGDTIRLVRHAEPGQIVAGLCDETGQPYAIVEFIGEE